MNTMIKAIVTDIEGTTTSLSFAKDVLLPYSYERVAAFLLMYHDEPDVAKILKELEASGEATSPFESINLLAQWIEEGKKTNSVKCIQSRIWELGYESGELKGHVYEDVAEVLKRWKYENFALYTFSSTSVPEQKMLFAHTVYGDLAKVFRGNFDLKTGGKKEVQSYVKIAQQIEFNPDEILYLSDSIDELDAAAHAGWHTLQLVRSDSVIRGRHKAVEDFYTIEI